MLDSGLCFYSKTPEVKMDSDLFGGFFIAIDSVAKAMGADNISSLVIDRALYTFSRVFNLLFVIRTNAGVKEDRVRKLLAKVKQVFFKHFPPEQYWEKPALPRVTDASIERDDMIGHIPYKQEKIQKLDAEYEEMLVSPLEKLKTAIWF